jgi:hypothetical protein
VFHRVSQCVPLWVYFTLVCSVTSTALPYPFVSNPSPHFSIALKYNPYILCLHRCYVLQYCQCSVILFPCPSFPKFHKVVSLLQTFYVGVYIWSSLFLHICFIFWKYLPCMRENMWPLCFWAWLISLNMMSSNYIHLLSNNVSLFLMANIYQGFLIHSSVVRHVGCFHSLAIVSSAVMNYSALMYRYLYCILTYVLLGRCLGAVYG